LGRRQEHIDQVRHPTFSVHPTFPGGGSYSCCSGCVGWELCSHMKQEVAQHEREVVQLVLAEYTYTSPSWPLLREPVFFVPLFCLLLAPLSLWWIGGSHKVHTSRHLCRGSSRVWQVTGVVVVLSKVSSAELKTGAPSCAHHQFSFFGPGSYWLWVVGSCGCVFPVFLLVGAAILYGASSSFSFTSSFPFCHPVVIFARRTHGGSC
jgi:hypothetical protein